MKIIFFGSDDFAAVSLSRLIDGPHRILAVVTPPDRARDRGKVTFLPVKQLALEHQIPVFQPEDPEDPGFRGEMEKFLADVFVVIAYGRILSNNILQMPKNMCINVHASLLPAYRGAAPINYALMDGQTRTGISIIKMNERMDAGEILCQSEMAIAPVMNARDLREALADLGAATLVQCLEDIAAGRVVAVPQNEALVSFASKLTRQLEKIHWDRPAREIHNLIRGLAPRPGTYGIFHDRRLKILRAFVMDEEQHQTRPGTITDITPQGIVVACGQGHLVLEYVHPESSKPMNARSFGLGHHIAVGDCFKTEK